MITFIQGILFAIISLLFKDRLPKKINSVYGFRTKKSMTNQKEWDKSQNLFRYYLKKCVPYQLILGLIIAFIEIKLYFVGYTNLFVILIVFESILDSFLLLYIIKKTHNQI